MATRVENRRYRGQGRSCLPSSACILRSFSLRTQGGRSSLSCKSDGAISGVSAATACSECSGAAQHRGTAVGCRTELRVCALAEAQP